MKSLDELVNTLPAQDAPVCDIDLSEQLGEAPGTTVFSFLKPTAAQVFQSGEDGPRIAARYPDMTTSMGAVVSLMALSHVAPASETPKGLLYAQLATKNSDLFMWLMGRFYDTFPALKDVKGAIKQKKRESGAD